MKLPYKEGDWFAVPLDSGKFVVGRIARASKKGKVILGYFFGKKFDGVPNVTDVSRLQPQEAIWVARFGDLGLFKGEWTVIGQESWDRAQWPMPIFVSQNPLNDKIRARAYSDIEPAQMVGEVVISKQDAVGLWEDGVAGAGFVVERIKRLLGEARH